ncbi:GNAT family N-acetyltransferase [Lactobacillus sp. ESL0684]|uniref:GNAT family N-acetyltransferase n=1 Tax=unclassified Lactobacillus TaxID=2620435 RepID=UPI0023F70792|nr:MULTISPECIES: GNAT family N-acetyltransferase [unclassified Lactobacillus]WEV40160.1 GNAT family N-acetyltransferase [Lactobacillus sp. ESL0681]WEV43318.1 GNAT family N-acetyltransferase [Lactobacillus sp. ESL0684]
MLVYIRKAVKEDLPAIIKIIDNAKQLLKEDGSPQWQDGRPNQAMFEQDIALKRAYVLVVKQKIAGVAVLQTTPDSSYAKITGKWHNNQSPYATIHRIAIDSEFRGQHLGQTFISNLLSCAIALGFSNFRIDTHALNKRMQALIESMGYQYCGIVQVDQTEDGARYAYELNL